MRTSVKGSPDLHEGEPALYKGPFLRKVCDLYDLNELKKLFLYLVVNTLFTLNNDCKS